MVKFKREEWKSIVFYKKSKKIKTDKYKISNFGRIKNDQTGNILKPSTDRYGYKFIRLKIDNVDHIVLIHRLVAYAFIGIPLIKR